jgi:hypothetical protein
MPLRAMVPVLVTVDDCAVEVVKVSVEGLAVAAHVPLVTDSEPSTFPLIRLAAPAGSDTRSAESSRTVATATVLLAARRTWVAILARTTTG